MGIIDALTGSIDGALADSWLEAITSKEYIDGQLVAIGYAMHSSRGCNTNGNPDVITDGSKIFVGYRETALVIENGELTNVFSEAGNHTFHSDLSKGFFSGKTFAEGVKIITEDSKERFTYGGDKALVQKVYYINQREILGNVFVTPNPIPVRITIPDINYDVDCSCQLQGMYSFTIKDAVAFYKNFVGNTPTSYFKDGIVSLINSILLTAIQPAIARLFSEGTRPAGMVEYVEALAKTICEETTKRLGPERGLELVNCGISSFSLTGSDLHYLQTFERDKVLKDPTMAAAHLVGATADAMQTIAYSVATDPTKGYGIIGAALLQDREAKGIKQEPKTYKRYWRCECGHTTTGKFCNLCGHPEIFECKQCGAIVTGKFCTSCGAKLEK